MLLDQGKELLITLSLLHRHLALFGVAFETLQAHLGQGSLFDEVKLLQ
jgi:hypothetical protein